MESETDGRAVNAVAHVRPYKDEWGNRRFAIFVGETRRGSARTKRDAQALADLENGICFECRLRMPAHAAGCRYGALVLRIARNGGLT